MPGENTDFVRGYVTLAPSLPHDCRRQSELARRTERYYPRATLVIQVQCSYTLSAVDNHFGLVVERHALNREAIKLCLFRREVPEICFELWVERVCRMGTHVNLVPR